ncbi:MAG TPA: site-specific DNA-methyltransferase [Acidimicrobiales bacterium]|nr:site-specific DNA-methyltransferase [Acidimicrobiales bacterium]
MTFVRFEERSGACHPGDLRIDQAEAGISINSIAHYLRRVAYHRPMERSSTSTSNFGVSRRENHDSSAFYERFTPPEISGDSTVASTTDVDRVILGDARNMSEIHDNSVALVVTSPPYFAGKQYEEALGENGVPGTYLEYLEMLGAVFKECVRVLEPGGRIAVNVANLGRRPYRSLAADVTTILQDDLRLLLRGEVIWLKQRGSSGSCAWGSFQRSTNPVLRDLTERVIIASKGRFDRALSLKERTHRGLPASSTMTREDFMENTLDLWEIPSESATRIGHPAPFPIELPARLIELYTFEGDLVLDPFLGAGTTAVAATRLNRRYAGYELDAHYLELARVRIAREQSEHDASAPFRRPTGSLDDVVEMIDRGHSATDISRQLLMHAGFSVKSEQVNIIGGFRITFKVENRSGDLLYFDVAGAFTHARAGLKRSEVLWHTIGQAAVMQGLGLEPLIVLTAGLPDERSPQCRALRACTGTHRPIAAVIDILDPESREELTAWALGDRGGTDFPPPRNSRHSVESNPADENWR